MAGTDDLPMQEEFARWYGEVSLGGDQGRREARWEGVCTIVREASSDIVEGLLRLAHQSRHTPRSEVMEAIRHAFRGADEAFEMTGNDRELLILAGTCLAALMEETDEDVGAVAALAATTAGFGGARHPNLPMDLAALGETAIVRRGDGNRKRPSLTEFLKTFRKFDFQNAETKVTDEQTFEGTAEAFKLAANKVRASMSQLTETHADAIRAIDHFLRVQDEELQMLWWLTSRRSWELECTFDDIPPDARPLVLASDLASNTEFLPGPPSVKGILSRAGLKQHETIRVVDSVNAADSGWLKGLVEDMDPSFVSTPLHVAIKRQLETGPGDAWVAGWAASTEVSDDYALSSLELGNLFYRERLLLLLK